MILDSSLRCAAFRMTEGGMAAFGMTGGRGGCAQNDRGERALCSGWRKGELFGMTEWGGVRNDGMNMPVFGMAEWGTCHFE